MNGKILLFITLLGLAIWMPAAQANSLAIFRTTLGEMAVELFDEDKPVTVHNFLLLERFGAYHNSMIHRCEPGFVAQGGAYYVSDSTSTNLFVSAFSVPHFGPITNEFNVGPVYSNVYGTIAMAKVPGDPDSATSQWFFNLADNSSNLDNQNGGFTVFGRVIRGSNVLEALNNRAYTNGIVNLVDYYGSSASAFTDLPVTYIGDRPPQYNELVYPGIEIMMVQISPDPSGRLLEWNSPSTMVCRIEYQDMTGGDWETLHLTNGNGMVQGVIDTNTAAVNRTYRIRVE